MSKRKVQEHNEKVEQWWRNLPQGFKWDLHHFFEKYSKKLDCKHENTHERDNVLRCKDCYHEFSKINDSEGE